jgi:hypothetical protein
VEKLSASLQHQEQIYHKWNEIMTNVQRTHSEELQAKETAFEEIKQQFRETLLAETEKVKVRMDH